MNANPVKTWTGRNVTRYIIAIFRPRSPERVYSLAPAPANAYRDLWSFGRDSPSCIRIRNTAYRSLWWPPWALLCSDETVSSATAKSRRFEKRLRTSWTTLAHLHFTQIHRLLPGIVFPFHAFYGHLFAGVLPLAQYDGSIGSITQLGQCDITIHDTSGMDTLIIYFLNAEIKEMYLI